MAEPPPTRSRVGVPLEVRRERQRRRLFAAAGAAFARQGYADATAEGIAREAGMSKATFYEHFGNKEDCIVALFDVASQAIIAAMRDASGSDLDDPADRYRASIGAFLHTVEAFPDEARTLLVEIIGAGPRAMERRDRVMDGFADFLDASNEADAAAGVVPRYASPEDAFAIVGAVVELVSRQLRTGRPERLADLAPVVERLVQGMLAASAAPAATA